MFLISRPSEGELRRFLAESEGDTFSYPEVGATRLSAAPEGYVVDHNRQLLGHGSDGFERAVWAVQNWRMFEFSWVRLFDPLTRIEKGETVAIVIDHYGFYSLNSARIVYTIDESQTETRRFGFAYGTLSEHGEIGEERFSVELNAHGEVWYDLYAFSRPGSVLARIGNPLVRRLQRQFARDSKVAMLEAVARPGVEFPK
jgi:uncharacterized protein (UPF0548 family)